MDEMTAFEKFLRTELLAVPEIVDCIASRVFNLLAPSKAVLPYCIFQLVPLQDRTGQARTPIQTRCEVDVKILTGFPVPASVTTAIAAVKEHFRGSNTFDSNGYRISVRHERPISYIETGATAEERILHRGGSFRVWMSKI